MKTLTLLYSAVLLFCVRCTASSNKDKANYVFGELKGVVIGEKIVSAPPKLLKTIVIFPRRNTVIFSSNSQINGVEEPDLEKLRKGYRKAEVSITEGRVGRKNIRLQFKGTQTHVLRYKVRIFSDDFTNGQNIGITSGCLPGLIGLYESTPYSMANITDLRQSVQDVRAESKTMEPFPLPSSTAMSVRPTTKIKVQTTKTVPSTDKTKVKTSTTVSSVPKPVINKSTTVPSTETIKHEVTKKKSISSEHEAKNHESTTETSVAILKVNNSTTVSSNKKTKLKAKKTKLIPTKYKAKAQ